MLEKWKDGCKKVEIPYFYILAAADLYLVLPVVIFFFGWLKIGWGWAFSGIVLAGMFFLVREQSRNHEKIRLPWAAVLLIFLTVSLWVYCSGVGGFWLQKPDWHWRNAILRDLVDYSWPVVYPETGNALVYYITYFLVPALAGKLFGFTAANVILLLWTMIGICICIFLLCKYLQIDSVKMTAVILLLFVVWRGFDGVRNRFVEMLGLYESGYEYTCNHALLQWVTNQTIVPWVAALVFLTDRKLRNYAFLGLSVLASAPLPFAGFFVLLAADGIYQFVCTYDKNGRAWMKDVCSMQNLCAVCSLLPVYGFYYAGNTAANGSAGKGGFGFFIAPENFTMVQLLIWLLFCFFQFFIVSVLIYKDYRKDFLFWMVNLSLFVIPFFKLGEGRDFCMRASIPALILLMAYAAKYIWEHGNGRRTAGLFALTAFLGVFTVQYFDEWCTGYMTVKSAQTREALWMDHIHTLANKSTDAVYLGSGLSIYLSKDPYGGGFFSLFGQLKTKEETEHDRQATQAFLKEEDFLFVSGQYRVTPADMPISVLAHDGAGQIITKQKEDYRILISDSVQPGKYEIYFQDTDQVMIFPEWEEGRARRAVLGELYAVWPQNDMPEKQLFEIRQEEGGYCILWNNEYALTYEEGQVSWQLYRGGRSQLWLIDRAKKD